MKYKINDLVCIGCAGCYTFCPVHAPYEGQKQATMQIDEAKCVGCGKCAEICPVHAIGVQNDI